MAPTSHPQVGHVMPLRVLFGVLAVLLVMTYVTVAVSNYDFGRYNLWVALGIALFKASLVLLFFMHLKYDKPFNAIVIIISLAFVMLFIAGALTDATQYQPNKIPGYAPSIKTNPQ
jgi:cytochrome c oxidase subunit 4